MKGKRQNVRSRESLRRNKNACLSFVTSVFLLLLREILGRYMFRMLRNYFLSKKYVSWKFVVTATVQTETCCTFDTLAQGPLRSKSKHTLTDQIKWLEEDLIKKNNHTFTILSQYLLDYKLQDDGTFIHPCIPNSRMHLCIHYLFFSQFCGNKLNEWT